MGAVLYCEETFAFDADGLRLEGILAYPESARPCAAVLVLAPHPQMGGNMENNVVRHLARRCAECGAVTLRFNYRGVGRSEIRLAPGESRFDYFTAMEEAKAYDILLPDCAAAYRALEAAAPETPRRVVLGYSLGAILATMTARRVRAPHLIGISPPVRRAALMPHGDCAASKCFFAGDDDFAFARDLFDEQFAHVAPPKVFRHLSGCDHFFRREEEHLFDLLKPYLFGGAGEIFV